MRRRPSARLLVVDPEGRVLLFRFVSRSGPTAGEDYWGTPGGGLEADETFEQTAVRELFEETGIRVERVDAHVAERVFPMRMLSGEQVMAQERFYVVRVARTGLSREGWSPDEVDVIAEHKWWTREEIAQRQVQIWPEDILEMLASAGVATDASASLRRRR